MASILKNQILKHLSKFTKNLSPDKLQLSAIKGSFEVRNIELNEDVLMELLELPVWIKLTKAHCNFASIKIQWMKLKTVPIGITLDEVVIHGEICEEFRQESHTGIAQKLAQDSTSSYGFTQKIIDGITLMINSVNVQFSSQIFNASIELTRICVESRNCLWKKVDDLSKTRIRDPSTGLVLLFKHIEWQTFRFVANSSGQAPLRLIANQATCRLTLKKRLSDCAILGARIMVIFDDLLWVLTDSQLLSALRFVDYLGGLIDKAPRTKNFENTAAKNAMHEQAKAKMMGSPKKVVNGAPSTLTTLFNQHDFLETSHHLIVKRIEVHLMDDCVPQSVKSGCSELGEGGALQMTFLHLLIDVYPYQQIAGSRKHWFRYTEPSPNRQSFINHKLRAFFSKTQNAHVQSQLMSRVVVVRLSDYNIGMVSTNKSRGKNNDDTSEASKLILFDKSKLIPSDMSPIYIEINSFFYVDGDFGNAVPEPTMFASVAPVKINFDPLTLLWINAFFSNLRIALVKLQEAFPQADSKNSNPLNLRVEIMSPTVVVALQDENVPDYCALEIKVSRILIFNSDSALPPDYFKSLEGMLKYFASNMDFYFEKENYPWLGCDMKSISNEFVHQITRWFASKNEKSINCEINFLSINLEPIWIEFKSAITNTYDSFLEPVNATLWMREGLPGESSGIDMNIIVRVNNPVKIQLTHAQLMFLLRLLEKIGDFTAMLNFDQLRIQSSHMKDNFEENNVKHHNDHDIIKNIFKTTAVVTSVPEVNIFLKISEEEMEIADSILDSDESIKQEIDNGSTSGILSIHDVSPLEENIVFETVGQLKENVSLQPENSTQPQSTEFDEVSEAASGTCPPMQSPQVPKSPMNTLNNSARLTGLSASNSSFDATSLKIHYSSAIADNDDSISTMSDYSDNDPQSLFALINEADTNYDDIFAEEAEVAEELSENFGKSADDASPEKLDATMNVSVHKPKEVLVDVLQVQIRDLNLIHQTPRGFLSQIFIDSDQLQIQEHFKLSKDEFGRLFREGTLADNKDDDELQTDDFRLRLRIDSFTKGSLKEEMISVLLQNLKQALHKETIDSVVKFFEDKFALHVAPTAIVLENVAFKIIDTAVKVPPAEFNIPRLMLGRDATNRWLIDSNSSSRGATILKKRLLERHLSLLEKNELGDSEQFACEKNRLLDASTSASVDDVVHADATSATKQPASPLNSRHESELEKLLEQVLTQKDVLEQEIELLRKENSQLRTRLQPTE